MKAQIFAAKTWTSPQCRVRKKDSETLPAEEDCKKVPVYQNSRVIFDIEAIKRILPHRYPFLLVDKIVDFKLDERVVGIKNVSSNEPFFNGHFPAKPIMPGVLIVEAMAQTGGILLLNGLDNPDGKLVYFMAMNNVKWRKPVAPGDQLIMQVEMISRRSKMAVLAGKAFCGWRARR